MNETTLLPLILCVEDSDGAYRIYEKIVQGRVRLLRAKTVKTALTLYHENKNELAAVIVDGVLGIASGPPNGVEVPQAIQKDGFKNPIIAGSDDSDTCIILMQGGCTHNPFGETPARKSEIGGKEKAAQLLIQLLFSEPKTPEPKVSKSITPLFVAEVN